MPFRSNFFYFKYFFNQLPIVFDPKCYTWMESSRSEDFFGVLVEKIGLTIWCPDFCDGHRTELCSIAETLSYRFVTKLWLPCSGEAGKTLKKVIANKNRQCQQNQIVYFVLLKELFGVLAYIIRPVRVYLHHQHVTCPFVRMSVSQSVLS